MGAPGLSFGPFRLDPADGRVWRGREPLALPPKAFALLQYLLERAGRLVPKDELLDALWPETFVEEAVLKVQISEIRKVLGDDPRSPRFIETVHRRGYRFVAAAVSAEPAAGSGTVAGSPAGLAGRDAEIARLLESYRLAEGGQRQIVLVTGEGGIGKTALVDAFTAILPPMARRARGQCLEQHGGGEAYLPILEAFAQLCRDADGRAVIDVLRCHAPSWLAQLPSAVPPNERSELLRAAARSSRDSMQREMAEAIDVLTADQLLLLVLEDLHWSDTSSIALLARLAHRRAASRLLLVATYRPVELVLQAHPLRELQQRLTQQKLCSEIQMPFLEAGAIEKYLEQRLDESRPPLGLADVIRQRTGGNALFVVDFIDDLLARGALVPDADHARLTVPMSSLHSGVPEGVRQMIEAQLEKLPALDATLLEAASVAGEEFLTAAIAAVTDEPVAEVERFCQTEVRRSRYLEATGVTTLDDGEACGRYRFRHALYREVLYRRLPGPRRTLFHKELGRWLEKRGAGASELARHFVAAAGAGCTSKAVEYSRLAAARAESLFACGEAALHYETALGVLERSGDGELESRGDLLISLGDALARGGNLSRAVEAFLAATGLARGAAAAPLFARAVLGLGRAQHVVTQSDDRLIALLAEADARLDVAEAPLRACVLARLDTALSPLPGTQARREGLRPRAVALARQADDPTTWLWVLQFLRWGSTLRADEQPIEAPAAALARLADEAPTREHAMHFHLLRIAERLEQGDLPAGTRALAELRTLADESAIPWFRWSVLRIETMLALQAGDFTAAKALADEAVRAAEPTDNPNVWAVFQAQSVHRYVMQGRFGEVEPVLRPYVEANPQLEPPRVALANLYMQAGDLARARRHFEILAASDFEGIPRDGLWLISMSQVVELCAALGDAERAAILESMLAGYLDRVIGAGPGLTAMGHGERYAALLHQTLGRWDAAALGFARAIDTHERMGARPWLAYSLVDRARLLLRRPLARGERSRARGESAADLQRAAGLADEIGMRGVSLQVEMVQRRLNARRGVP